ncbi:MAG: hypothetical protein SCALA701_03960 [Candidatus Scalindua sp.]|nr:MAG: hypothetical protein SCALA701_03960 [Candidatus Scalindua sp.]
MKQEELEWVAKNPFYTKRFAHYVEREGKKDTIGSDGHVEGL